MTLVWLVTATVSRCVWPSLTPLYTSVRPTGNGKYGLSTTATKLFGSNTGAAVALAAPACATQVDAISAIAMVDPVKPATSFLTILPPFRNRPTSAPITALPHELRASCVSATMLRHACHRSLRRARAVSQQCSCGDEVDAVGGEEIAPRPAAAVRPAVLPDDPTPARVNDDDAIPEVVVERDRSVRQVD